MRSVPVVKNLCPACGRSSQHCFDIGTTGVYECTHCWHRHSALELAANHVEANYDDDYFFAGGAGYSNYLANEPLVRAQGRRYARVAEKVLSQLNCIDGRAGQFEKDVFSIGAAAGFELAGFRDGGWKTAGLEPNASMVAHATNQLKLDVVQGYLENFEPTRAYTLVTAIQVMAHFTDVRRAAEKFSQLVCPGGILLIETWNYRSWTARLFGKNWHEYSPPTVLQWFSPESLARLLADFGFREIKRGRPSKRILGEHARSLLEYKLKNIFPLECPVNLYDSSLPV